MDAIKYIHEQMTPTRDFPAFRPGDKVVVKYRIVEGDKERIQSFRGNVIQLSWVRLQIKEITLSHCMEELVPGILQGKLITEATGEIPFVWQLRLLALDKR